MRRTTPASLLPLLLAACASHGPGPAPAVLPVPEPLRALGTEPFWGALVAGGTLTYITPEDQAGTAIRVTRTGSATEAVYAGTLRGQPFTLRVSRAACSDGMSDRTYPYTASLTIGDDLRRGCALAASDWRTGE